MILDYFVLDDSHPGFIDSLFCQRYPLVVRRCCSTPENFINLRLSKRGVCLLCCSCPFKQLFQLFFSRPLPDTWSLLLDS